MKKKLIILIIFCIAALLCFLILKPGTEENAPISSGTKKDTSTQIESTNNTTDGELPVIGIDTNGETEIDTNTTVTGSEQHVSSEKPYQQGNTQSESQTPKESETKETQSGTDTDTQTPIISPEQPVPSEDPSQQESPVPEPETPEESEDIDTELPLIP